MPYVLLSLIPVALVMWLLAFITDAISTLTLVS